MTGGGDYAHQTHWRSLHAEHHVGGRPVRRRLRPAGGGRLRRLVALRRATARATSTGTSATPPCPSVRRAMEPAGQGLRRQPGTGGSRHASVLALEDGGFIVQWDNGFLGGPDADRRPHPRLRCRRRTSGAKSGARSSRPRRLHTSLHARRRPDVIAWNRLADNPVDAGTSIRARILDSDGIPVGDDLQSTTPTPATRTTPMAVALPDGRFLVAWETDYVLWEGRLIPTVSSAPGSSTPTAGRRATTSSSTPSATLADFSTLRVARGADGSLLVTW